MFINFDRHEILVINRYFFPEVFLSYASTGKYYKT